MNKLTFDDIDELVELSQFPLKDRYLEVANKNQEPYYRFLYHLVLRTLPDVCLEIGVEWGLGSAHLCEASSPDDFEDSYVIGIDINTSVLVDGLHAFYGNYHFIQLDSTSEKAEKWTALLVRKYGGLGIVFQDSSHHYEASCQEWDIYSHFLDRNAIWICDDVTPDFYDPDIGPWPLSKGMVQYFQERPGEKKLYDNLHHGSIVGVILTNGN